MTYERTMGYEISPYEFTEEDLAAQPAWFIDNVHWAPTMGMFSPPFMADIVSHGFLWGAETLSLPESRGLMWRSYKFVREIISPLAVTSEDECKERQARFMRNIISIIVDFDKVWSKYKSELMDLYRPIKKLQFEKTGNIELITKWLELRSVCYRMAEIHCYMMYAVFESYRLFEELCKELLGIESYSQDFKDMVSGFDNKSFENERELWRLSREVLVLGLGEVFKERPDQIAPRLSTTENGKKWLSKLDEYLDEFGWKCLICWVPDSASWQDDPKYAIERVKSYLTLTEFHQLEIQKKQAKERERTVSRISSRVPKNKRELFDLFLSGAQHAGLFSEEHDFYCEQYTDALLRRYLLEFGRRFVAGEAINNRDDIFYLGFDEITKMAICPQDYRLQHLVEKRSAMLAEIRREEIPVAVSKTRSPEECLGWLLTVHDPVIVKVIVGELPQAKPELKADLMGVCGCLGIAEGRARVVVDESQLADVQPGEILVCPTTTISWTPIFALVKGVITDRGGSLSHAAIVSREYNIPCILNTFIASATIRTGQMIKMDGATGAVYILEK